MFIKRFINKIAAIVTVLSCLVTPANALDFSFDYGNNFGAGGYKKGIVYTFLSALNASNTNPRTSLVGTNITQIATGSVVVPLFTDTSGASQILTTVAAGYPVVPGARISYDVANWAVAGANVLTAANAIEDDTNATTGWTGVTTDVFESQNTVTNGSNYAFHVNSNATAQANSRIYKALSGLTDGKTYQLDVDVRHVGTGNNWRVSISASNASGSVVYSDITVADVTFRTVSLQFIFSSSFDNIVFSEASGDNTGGLYIDNIKVREITPAYLPTTSLGAAISTPTVLASGLTRYDGSGLGNVILPSFTNKCTCRKYNPTDTTNITKSGDAASVLSVVDDTAALTAAGLISLCSLGDVYKLDNSTGVGIAAVEMTGAVTSTNKHSGAIYWRGTGSASLCFSSETVSPSALSATYTRTLYDNKTPVGGAEQLKIRAAAGAVVYFILPSLTETTTAPPFPVITFPTDAAAASTMPPRYTSAPGSSFGQKLNFVVYSYEALAAGGRDVTLFSDGTRVVKYQGAAGLLVARDESLMMGANLWPADYSTLTIVQLGDGTVSAGVGTATCTVAASGRAYLQLSGLPVGKTYKITGTYTVSSGTPTGSLKLGTNTTQAYGTTQAINYTATQVGTEVLQIGIGVAATHTGVAEVVLTNIVVKEVAELTYDVDLSANTQYHIGLDLGTAASMSVEGTTVATATWPSAVEWGATVYQGAKVITGTASEVLNGSISVIQSSNDERFLETSKIINLPNYENIIYLADRRKKIKIPDYERKAA